MGEDVEKRLQEKSLGGVPLLDPDQQRRYLGTFKERCVALLPVEALEDELFQKTFQQKIQQTIGGHLLINGAITNDLQNIYLQLALKEKIPFTIVNSQVSNDPKAVGVIYALDTVSGVSQPDLTQEKGPTFSTPSTLKEPAGTEKKSLWKRLFSND